MMRSLGNRWWALVVVGLLASCGSGDDDPTPGQNDVTGGDDVAPGDADDPSDERPEDVPDVPEVPDEPDVPEETDPSDPSDPSDPEEVDTNACGGLDPLTFEGDAADVGDACGVCQDGALVCDGGDALTCEGAGALNACGGCGFLPNEPGAGCGPCGSAWICDGEDAVTCDRVVSNACGGCAVLDDTPGATCDAGDGEGVWVCAEDDDSLRCDLDAANACGGVETLDPPPGEVCGPCNDGVTRCDGADQTRCEGASESNLCGGCGTLQGEPETDCGQGGTWVCDGDSVFCDEPDPNACGGFDVLRGEPGDACAWGASWICDGDDAVACRVPESWRNARAEASEETGGAAMQVELALEGLDEPIRLSLPAGSWQRAGGDAAEIAISVRDWDDLDAALEHVEPEAPALRVEISGATLDRPARLAVPLQEAPALAMRVEPGAYRVDDDGDAPPQPLVTRSSESGIEVLLMEADEDTVVIGTTVRASCEDVVCDDVFVEEACTETGVRLESAPVCTEGEGCVVPFLEHDCTQAADGAPHCFDGACFTANACDGRAELSATPGTPCGACSSGLWACDGTEALRCDGDAGEDARNACGGCDELPGGFDEGGLCDVCGTWTCGPDGESGTCDVPAEGCPETCEELACEDLGRVCDEGDVQAGEASQCGDCQDGYATESGVDDGEATCWLQPGDRGLDEGCSSHTQCASGVCGKRPDYFEYFVRGLDAPDGTFVGSSEGGYFLEEIDFLVRFMFSPPRVCLEPCVEEGSVCSRGRSCRPTPEWMDIGAAEVGNRSFYGLAGEPGEPARALCVEPGVCDLDNGFFIDRDGDTFGGDDTYEPVEPLHCPPALSMALQRRDDVHSDGVDPDGTPPWEGGDYWWVATRGGDCDDTDPNVYPGAPNRCDGKDTSCSGEAPDTGGDAVCAELAEGAECIDAGCQLTNCADDRGDCDGNVFNGCESDLLTSRQHCGGCGIACEANEFCEEGACVSCDEGELWCPSRTAVSVEGCTESTRSTINCGGCGITCAIDEVCEDGTCQLCPTGQVRCGTACVDDNGCGGCRELAAAPGSECEVCGVESEYACDGPDRTLCDVTADQCLTEPLELAAVCTHPAECGEGAWCPPRARISNRAWPEYDRRCTPLGQTYVPQTAPQSIRLGPGPDEIGSFQPPEVQYFAATTTSFFMDQHEVTQGEWEAIAGMNPSRFDACGETCPVDSVSWWSALWYANQRSIAEGLTPCYALPEDCDGDGADGTLACGAGWPSIADPAANDSVLGCEGYRLPTDAEWETAARQGLPMPTFGGSILLPAHVCLPQVALDAWAWHCGNAEVEYDGCENRSGMGSSSIYGFINGLACTGPMPVGTRRPSEIGLYDMLGNADEWVWDSSARSLDTEGLNIDPIHDTTGIRRLVRGGAWLSLPRDVRFAAIDEMQPNLRSFAVGFRLVRSAPLLPFLADCEDDERCVTGYCNEDGVCILRPQSCERLGCAERFRDCVEADGGTNAVCTDCLDGWVVNDDLECEPEEPSLDAGEACLRAGECRTGICGPQIHDVEGVARAFLVWLADQDDIDTASLAGQTFRQQFPLFYGDNPITEKVCLAPCESTDACGGGRQCVGIETLIELEAMSVVHPESPAGQALPSSDELAVCVDSRVCHPGAPRYRDADRDGFGAGAPYDGDIPDVCPPTVAMLMAWAEELTEDGYPGFGPEGWTLTPQDGDCDDTNASIYPGAPNRCDGRDTQCVGVVDSDDICESLALCDDLTEADETGEFCDGTSDCAEGAVCVAGVAGARARCMQACLFGECTLFCGEEERCALTEPNPADPQDAPRSMTLPGQPAADGDMDGICFGGGTCEELLPPSFRVGTSCDPESEVLCDDGSVCLDLSDGLGPRCQRTCVPGVCEDSCNEGDECRPLVSGDFPWELTPLVAGGFCREALEPVDPYGACGTGATGECREDSVCVGYGATPATCAQYCSADESCEDVEGFEASCSLQVAGEPICAILCEDTAGSSDCPSFLTCIQLAPGLNVCAQDDGSAPT